MDTSLLFLVVQNKSVYTKKVRGDAVERWDGINNNC